MDLTRLRQGETIAALSGLALFLIMFLGWYGFSGGEALGGATDSNAWESYDLIDLILLLAVVVSVAVAVITASGAAVSLPAPGSALVTGIGAIAFLLVLYRLINPPGEADLDREIGIWLGLLATAGITTGGYLAMQEEGASIGPAPPTAERDYPRPDVPDERPGGRGGFRR